jgi:hypothetical protein
MDYDISTGAADGITAAAQQGPATDEIYSHTVSFKKPPAAA